MNFYSKNKICNGNVRMRMQKIDYLGIKSFHFSLVWFVDCEANRRCPEIRRLFEQIWVKAQICHRHATQTRRSRWSALRADADVFLGRENYFFEWDTLQSENFAEFSNFLRKHNLKTAGIQKP